MSGKFSTSKFMSIEKIKVRLDSGSLMDKTMDDKLMYKPNDDK